MLFLILLPQYSETISENARVGTSVLRVLATSKDAGQNAEISYSLVAGNEHNRFSIDSKSGVISIVQPLDYEGRSVGRMGGREGGKERAS